MEMRVRTERPNMIDGSPELVQPGGANMILRVLATPREERLRILEGVVDDAIVILFALLSPEERRQLVQRAEEVCKQQVSVEAPAMNADSPFAPLFRPDAVMPIRAAAQQIQDFLRIAGTESVQGAWETIKKRHDDLENAVLRAIGEGD
jgi:hypothetical protein